MCDPLNTNQVWAFYNCGCKTPANPCTKYTASLDVCMDTGKKVRGVAPHKAIFDKCPWHKANDEWKEDKF
jgi:hypothetical protein